MQGYNLTTAQMRLDEVINQLYIEVVSQSGDIQQIQQKALADIREILAQTEAPEKLTFNQRLDKKPLSLYLAQTQLVVFVEGLATLQSKYGFRFEATEEAASEEKEQGFAESEWEGQEEIVYGPYSFKKEGEDLIDEQERRFVVKSKLTGRGQSGLANFYTNGQTQSLIKEDDASTCVLEGTAYFAEHLLPPALKNAVNFATAGVVAISPKPMIVSVQPRVMPSTQGGAVKPWDVLVYGAKREPMSLVSWEQWYEGKLSRGIAELNSMAQWQLAAGIFTSQVVGDESLHVAQFMADVDADNNVIGIKRIDLGARERYARLREIKEEVDPYNTSAQYQSTGQFGKNYCGLMLKSPELNHKLTMLWARLSARSDIELEQAIKKSSEEAFIAQFAVIPEAQKMEALEGVLKVLNKGVLEAYNEKGISEEEKQKRKPITIPDNIADVDGKIAYVAKQLAAMDSRRVLEMKKRAIAKFENDIAGFSHDFEKFLSADDAQAIATYKHQLLKGENPEGLEDLIQRFNSEMMVLIAESHKNPTKAINYDQIRLMSKACVDLLEMIQLNEMEHPTGINLKALDQKIKLYQTYHDCACYCVTTSTKDKIPHAVKLMQEASKGRIKEYLQNNPNVIEVLGTHSSYLSKAANAVKKQNTSGTYLARKLFKRYSLNPVYLKLTPVQRAMLDYAATSRFKELGESAKKNYVNDVLVQDAFGRTALHYLMQHARVDNKESIEALAIILKAALGANPKLNSNLDIADEHGKTPLHYLLENPDAEDIIKAINAKGLSYSRFSGANRVDHFFVDATKYTQGELEETRAIGKGQKTRQSRQK